MILHVEDDDASAFLLQAALYQAAILNKIFRVSSGQDALAFLCKTGAYETAHSPALVILDLNLPRVDGWTVLKTMKRLQELKHIPVVILSSSSSDSDQSRALGMGADCYLIKQNTVAAMREVICECLGRLPLNLIIRQDSREATCP